jgi:hypothetical protein
MDRGMTYLFFVRGLITIWRAFGASSNCCMKASGTLTEGLKFVNAVGLLLAWMKLRISGCPTDITPMLAPRRKAPCWIARVSSKKTLMKLITSRWQYCPPISTGSKEMLQYSWQGPSERHGWCAYTLSSNGRVLLKSRMWEVHKSGSERGRSAAGIWKRYCGTIAKADGKLRTPTSS